MAFSTSNIFGKLTRSTAMRPLATRVLHATGALDRTNA